MVSISRISSSRFSFSWQGSRRLTLSRVAWVKAPAGKSSVRSCFAASSSLYSASSITTAYSGKAWRICASLASLDVSVWRGCVHSSCSSLASSNPVGSGAGLSVSCWPIGRYYPSGMRLALRRAISPWKVTLPATWTVSCCRVSYTSRFTTQKVSSPSCRLSGTPCSVSWLACGCDVRIARSLAIVRPLGWL